MPDLAANQTPGIQTCVTYSATGAAPAGCLVSATATPEEEAVGMQHVVTFLCGVAVGNLPGPLGPGCYDVQAFLTDITVGSRGSFDQGSTQANLICAPGFVASGGGACSPCPADSQIVAGSCHFFPAGGVCPAGSTAVSNPSGGIAYCTMPEFAAIPGPNNELVLRFNAGAAHSYLVQIRGFVATASDGTCPASTVLTPDVVLAGKSSGPACAFTLDVVQRAIEVTNIAVSPLASCNSTIGPGLYNLVVGQGCLAGIRAFGMVVLKDNVDCASGAEPATGSSATPAGFPPGSVYQCVGSALTVTNIPVANIPLSLTATNAVFNPLCFPLYPTSGTPVTATPVSSITPIATPRPTATSSGAATASVPGGRPPGVGPATCSPSGSNTASLVVGPNGQVNFFGTEVEYSALASPSNPDQNQLVDIMGHFAIDSVGRAGVPMYAQYIDAQGVSVSCGPALTDATGSSDCAIPTDQSLPGQQVFVNVDFILNCQDYMTTTSFTVGGSPTATPAPLQVAPAPNGLCLVRTAPGPITIRVVYSPTIDTQPIVDSGPIQIGQATFQTATPLPTMQATLVPPATPTNTAAPTPTAAPTSTATPTPTPTATATPTSTPTLTATPVPTSTPTASPTPIFIPRPLAFTLDAARVSKLSDRGNHRGLNLARQGQKVNLSMYYTVTGLPKALTRITTYEILHGGKTIFKAVYRGQQAVKDLGAFVRYIPYAIPRALPADIYTFRATLSIGSVSRSRTWSFAVVRNEIIAHP